MYVVATIGDQAVVEGKLTLAQHKAHIDSRYIGKIVDSVQGWKSVSALKGGEVTRESLEDSIAYCLCPTGSLNVSVTLNESDKSDYVPVDYMSLDF